MRFLIPFLSLVAIAHAQNPPPHFAFTGDKVHEIRLRFQQADFWEQLTRNYQGTELQAPYLEASLEWGPYKFNSVGVRFKGNSSYRVNGDKKPFRIKTNEFVKGQKIEGIGAFNLSNGFGDASLVREHPYYEMARALGLKAPRTNYAALYINDRYWGLYVLGEVVNTDFIQNTFGREKKEDEGNLYKGNIGAVFNYLGEVKAVYKEVWEKQTNEEADDWSDLIELCRIIGQTPASELRAKLEPLVDIDSFLTAIALDNATVNLDSYVGMGQNFNIYRRPSDGRWVWLVWDPSLAFGAFGQGAGTTPTQLATEYVQATGGAGGGGGGGGQPPGGQPPGGQPPGGQPSGGTPLPAGATTGRPLASKLWDIPEYKERYRQIYKDIVNRVFLPGPTVARMNALRAMIRPFVESDRNLLTTFAQFESAMTQAATGGQPGGGGGGLGSVALQPFIEQRAAWLKSNFEPQSFSTPRLSASVAALSFTSSAAQTINLNFSGVNTPPTFALKATTQSGGNWLIPNITGGPLPGSIIIETATKDVPPGAHSGALTFFLAGAQELVVPVTLTLGDVPAPSVSGIVNAASYSTGPLAPGQLATVFGANLGPATLATSNTGVRVTFDGAEGQILYAAAGQLGVVVPLSIAGKAQTVVTVSFAGKSSPSVTRPVAAAAPGIFTTDSSGTGTGAIINQTGAINSAANPAAKGSIIAIYLTGAGVTNADNRVTAATEATIAGQPATLVYAGAAPGAVQGLYQFNATVPAAAPSGAQPLTVTVGGVASQSGVTVHIQ